MFADVTALMLDWLRSETALAPWVSAVPTDRPDRFGQVRRLPGGRPLMPVREIVRTDVTCWATDEPTAMADLLEARTAIWALNGNSDLGVTVYEVSELSGPRQFTDPDTGRPRASMVVSLTVRADLVAPYAPPLTTSP